MRKYGLDELAGLAIGFTVRLTGISPQEIDTALAMVIDTVGDWLKREQERHIPVRGTWEIAAGLYVPPPPPRGSWIEVGDHPEYRDPPVPVSVRCGPSPAHAANKTVKTKVEKKLPPCIEELLAEKTPLGKSHLQSLNVACLRLIAKRLGVQGYSRMKRTQLVEHLVVETSSWMPSYNTV